MEKCGFRTSSTPPLTPLRGSRLLRRCAGGLCDGYIPTTPRTTLLMEERPDFCARVGATGRLPLKTGDESKTSLAIIEAPYEIHRTLSTPTNLHLPEHLGSCSLSQCEECNQMQIPPLSPSGSTGRQVRCLQYNTPTNVHMMYSAAIKCKRRQ